MQKPDIKFNETDYLAHNPDVKAAVEAGDFRSGMEHYNKYGKDENRVLHSSQTRRGKMLSGLDIAKLKGVEIGALASPLVKKNEGEIIYVDYADSGYLRKRYENDSNVITANIVDVDAIWGEKTLCEAIGMQQQVDYVVASHVVEHVPDLVAWLDEIHTILKPSGTLRLAVPDRRYTFDYIRNESNLADLVDASLRRARAPLPRMIPDFCTLSRVVDTLAAWRGPLDVSKLVPMSTPHGAMALARDAYDNGTYHDVHCWVFTPLSFINLFTQAAELGLIKFGCELFIDTVRNELEFIVGLRPGIDRGDIVESWKRARSAIA